MNYKEIAKDLILINYPSRKDSRGTFDVVYNKKLYSKIIKKEFLQENLSISLKKNTIRGIHLQLKPFDQAKLITVIKGSILDIAIDLRKNSKTFKKIFYFKMSESNKNQLFIPRGFGHGFCTLKDNTIISYKVDNHYNPKMEITIDFNDRELNVIWPKIKSKKYLSKKDRNGISLKDFIKNYYG